MESKIENSIKTIYENPLSLLQLVAIFIIATNVLITIVGWMIGIDVSQPKLLLGFGIILWVISKSNGGFVLTISVLLVGTVVAEDRLLLAVAALLRGESAAAVDFYNERKTTVAASRPSGDAQTTEQFAGLPSGAAVDPEQVSKIIERTHVIGTANAISEYSTPLESLHEGGREWSAFVTEYSAFEGFREDMRALRNAGIAVFEGENYESAQITQLGTQVFLYFQESQPSENLDEIVEPTPQSTSIRGALGIDGNPINAEISPNQIHEYTLNIATAGSYLIETSPPQGQFEAQADTFLAIYDAEGAQIASNDDRELDRFSRIEQMLEAGDYTVRVTDFFSALGAYQIKVSAIQGNP